MRQRTLLAFGYIALLICMTAGWHTWPAAIWLGFWLAGFRVLEYHQTDLYISDDELYKWLDG